MAKIVWDDVGEKLYETGVEKGVVYKQNDDGSYGKGDGWNGLISVSQQPSGAEENKLYADNDKYLGLISKEEFGATVEAYMYPDSFAECDGTAEPVPGVKIGQQTRKAFGMTYRTTVGNDVKGNDFGYKIHLIYGAKAQPSEKSYSTINDSPEAITFSWTLSTTPVKVKDYNSISHLEIDSTKFVTTKAKEALAAFEEMLYGKDPTQPNGTDGKDPTLPLPDKVIELLTVAE